jgi:hypothetical protein
VPVCFGSSLFWHLFVLVVHCSGACLFLWFAVLAPVCFGGSLFWCAFILFSPLQAFLSGSLLRTSCGENSCPGTLSQYCIVVQAEKRKQYAIPKTLLNARQLIGMLSWVLPLLSWCP